ncbi:glycosyltransferase family 2 protein [Halobacterium salinarum]|uniref:glycosyltransferase n=1 Tax=Halobacterium salinarum TaxID=2242 RepID=UPI001F2F5158|nr:glycosyltransferase family A protein [Halobacterium salinarum]MCF2238156.1 glycosyltransferase family 2 protein [Halobacterium salinarum]
MPDSPFVSVVVPVYNDPEGVKDTLHALVDQRDAPGFEVRVVDNDSTDETMQVIEAFAADHPEIYCHTETEIQSSYAARNTGIEHAGGDVIVFLDADVVVERTCLRDISRTFEGSDVDYVGCNVQMYNPGETDTFWTKYDLAMGLPVEHYLRRKRFAPTCALAVRREVIEAVGTFDDELVSGGDKEFGNRVSEAGFRMGFAEGIVAKHPARTSLKRNIQKSTRIGKGQVQLWAGYGLAAHPVSYTRYLPPDPRRVRNRRDAQFDLVSIYLAEILLKYVQSATVLYLYLKRLLKRVSGDTT